MKRKRKVNPAQLSIYPTQQSTYPQVLSCTSFNFFWASSYPTHLDKTPLGILRYSSPLSRVQSFNTFNSAAPSPFIRTSLMGIRQSLSHHSSRNLSFNISIIDFSFLLTTTLVLSSSNIICKPSAANASVNQFSFLGACSILKVENFSSIFQAIALHGARLGSFREKIPLAWQTTRFKSPITFKCLTLISRAVANPIRQVSYSAILFKQENSSLNDSAIALSSSQ